MSEEQAIFSRKTVAWLIAAGLSAFAGATYFMIYGDDDAAKRASANAYSYSAIGHRALVDTLRRLDIPVSVSRENSAAKVGHSSLLIMAEPAELAYGKRAMMENLTAERILLVLPKWQGRSGWLEPGWVESVTLVSSSWTEEVLQEVVPAGEVTRARSAGSWRGGQLGFIPKLFLPQLMEESELTPILASDRGVLIGELIRDDQIIWVLSDPDILSNHGIGGGDNAALTLRIIESLVPSGGDVIIDESIHGFRPQSSGWGAVLELPFAVSTFITVAALIVLMWAATARFGAPIGVKRPTEAGTAGLIDNTAGLHEYSGHGLAILRRYYSDTLREVGHRLHAPPRLDDEALSDWMDRVGDARGVRPRYSTIRRQVEIISGAGRVDSPRLTRAAQNIYRWKQEIINGSGGHRIGHPTT